jgi:superfamily II DNA or RNA helicase
MPMQLFRHQQWALEETGWPRDGGSALWSMPPGTGRTTAALALAQSLDQPTLLLVRSADLVQPALEILRGISIPPLHGGPARSEIVVAGRDRLDGAFWKTVADDRFGLVIVDDCDRDSATTWMPVTRRFPESVVLGVAGTVNHVGNARELYFCFGQRARFTYTLHQACEDGRLARVVPVRVDTGGTSLDNVHVRDGDFAVEELAAVVNTEARNEEAVGAYLLCAAGRRALAFAVDLPHARALTRKFQDCDVSAAMPALYGTADERQDVLAGFRAGRYSVLVGRDEDLAGEVDPRVADCLVMARPTLSPHLYQRYLDLGLGVDAGSGKQECLVVDLADQSSNSQPVRAPGPVAAPRSPHSGGCRRVAVDAGALWLRPPAALAGYLPPIESYTGVWCWQQERVTDGQLASLQRKGYGDCRGLTRGEASYLIEQHKEADAKGPATPNQRGFLQHRGYWRDGMTFGEASEVISWIKGESSGWDSGDRRRGAGWGTSSR